MAEKREGGGEGWEEAVSPSSPAMGLSEERCKFTSRVRGGAPAARRLSRFLRVHDGLSRHSFRHFNVVYSCLWRIHYILSFMEISLIISILFNCSFNLIC